jgi:PKD repeat protein
MHKKRRIIILSCILVSFVISTGIATDLPPFPGFPHAFWGTVTNEDGTVISNGTIIAAIVENETYYTTVANGKYGFNETDQAQNSPFFIEDPENNNEGKTIYFFIGGIYTTQTAVFIGGGNTNLNLVLPADEPGGENGGSTNPPGGTEPPTEKTPPTAHTNGPYLGVIGRPVHFNASNSNDSDGQIIQYLWDFGDLNTSSGISPTHTYTLPGMYTILLTVIDNDNLTDNDTTFVAITNDSDGDGWSNDEEIRYHTDADNSSDYPVDTDNDYIPDSVDTDDDNDGIIDSEELRLGSNPVMNTDVTLIVYQGMFFYFIDINNDGQPDIYYNTTTFLNTSLTRADTSGFYHVDVNNDGVWEYTYNANTGVISPYQKSLDQTIIMMLIIGIVIVLLLLGLISLVMYKNNKKRGRKNE